MSGVADTSTSAPASVKAAGALRIAFLDDDIDQGERIGTLLRNAGHSVYVFNRGRALLRQLRTETFDLIVLDWEVPDISGYDVLLTIRAQVENQTPVLFLTHRDGESDVVQALQAGADDFLIKPARERELLARVTAMSRRTHVQPQLQTTITVAPIAIDIEGREITRDGVALELTRREFEVALLLFRHLGQVLSRGFIMDAVWGHDDVTTTRTVDMHVSRVRKVLGLSAAIGLRLTAVYGYGYRLEQTGSDSLEHRLRAQGRGVSAALPSPLAGERLASRGRHGCVERRLLYRAQPRDTLIGLGRRLLLDPRRWHEVQERNHIVNPRAIPPGSILRIPYAWLRLDLETASVANVAGGVAQGGKAVAPGDTLGQGSVIETGADGSVTLNLADGSIITLQKSSVLNLDEMARVNGMAAAHSIRLRLRSGRVEAKVKPHRDVGRFEIMTPVAVSAVRGTEFRDSFDGTDLHSTAETLEGTVSVGGTTGTDAVPVAQGFGTRVEKDRAPLAPVVLLPPPSLAELPAVSTTPVMNLRLPPVPRAERYRFQLSTDAEFHALSADVVTSDGRISIAGLPDGTYWLRARSIDTLTIEGSDAVSTITQHVLPPAPAPSTPAMDANITGSSIHATWQPSGPTSTYSMEIATDSAFASAVIERAGLTGPSADIDDLKPGHYVWRVASVNAGGEKGPWSEARSFTLRPPMPMPDVPQLSKHAVAFTWTAMGGQTYHAQLARDSHFEHPLQDQQTNAATWSVAKLAPGTYYLRVQTIDADGSAGPYSPARRFTVPVPLWLKIAIPVAAGLAFLL